MKRVKQLFVNVLIVLILFSSFLYADTWSANRRLTKNAGESEVPVIAVDGTNIYVIWSNETSGNYDIYFKRSTDGGTTWSANRRLTKNAGESYHPAIGVNGSNIYVVWDDGAPDKHDIYFKRSTDRGTTWSANRRLTKNAGSSGHPAIAVDGLNIYVVWNDATPGNDEIYFKRSTDGGTTWSANRRLTKNAGESKRPKISVNGSNIYMVWREETPGNREIYFKRSADRGATWSADRRLTKNAGESQDPQISVNGSNIYVVWYDDTRSRFDYEIYFKRSADRGATWTANRRLTNYTGGSWSPTIAVDGSNIYVAWDDYTPGNSEIYFKRSADRGATWTANRRLTNNTGDSWSPTIAVDGSNIYVVWEDKTPGNWEIYFRKGILD